MTRLSFFVLLMTLPLISWGLQRKNPEYSIRYLVDSTGSLEAGQVIERFQEGNGVEAENDLPRFGITDHVIWVEIDLVNTTGGQQFIIWFEDPSIWSITQFLPNSAGELLQTEAGVSVTPSEKVVPGPDHTFSLQVAPGSQVKTYYRVSSRNFLSIPIGIYRLSTFYTTASARNNILGAYYGVLLFIVLFNVVFFITTRQRIFLWYLLNIISFGFITGTYDGYTPYYAHWVVELFNGYHDAIMVVASNIFALLFMRKFLSFKAHFPSYDRLVRVLIGLSLILFPLNFLIPATILKVIPLLSIFMIGVILWGSVLAVRKGVPQSLYFLLGYGIFAMFIALVTLSLLQVLPFNEVALYGLHSGYLASAIFLMIALGIRMNQMRMKLLNQQVQEQMLEKRIIEDKNRELKEKVRESTRYLRENEENLRAILDNNLDDAIWLVDTEYQLIDFNKYFSDMFKVAFGKSLKRNTKVIDYFDDEELRKRWMKRYDDGLRGLKGVYIDVYEVAGEKLTYEISTYPIRDHDEIRGVSVYSKNITEKSAFEAKLKHQNEELIKLNRELDRFVYSASHDLKAPLASVLGLISISRMEKKDKKRQEYYDLMEKSINKLNTFIKEIIDYSKSSRLELNYTKIDLAGLIQSVFEDLKYLEGADIIDFSTDLDLQVPFYSDERRVSMILSNVIGNAIIYSSSHNGPDNSRVRVIGRVSAEEAVIEVIDNGPGIDEEIRDKIFDMFYRGQEQIKGSGLGLFIVRETITRLKGAVEVESDEGHGSLFRIHIPNEGLEEPEVSETASSQTSE